MEDSSSDWSDLMSTPLKYNTKAGMPTMNLVSSQSCSQLSNLMESKASEDEENRPMRPLDECVKMMKAEQLDSLTDDEVIQLVEAKHIRSHALEKVLNNHLRGVKVRRKFILRQTHMKSKNLDALPYKDYDYEQVMGVCAENVIGVMTLPVGAVGPLKLDGKLYHIPMATTEGCLVASTNRGCSVLTAAGGVTSKLFHDGMTRGPCVSFPDINGAIGCKCWLEVPENFQEVKSQFDSTSRFARLQRIKVIPAGRKLFLRFEATTGDAMGMNMMSKATEHALNYMQSQFREMKIVSLSGNVCTDKKPSAMNWIEGRGKAVVCEATIPADVVEKTLKTTTKDLVELNINKNLVGSAMAGSIGKSCQCYQLCNYHHFLFLFSFFLLRWYECSCCKHRGSNFHRNGSRCGTSRRKLQLHY